MSNSDPGPTMSFIVEASEGVRITIYDAAGRKLHRGDGSVEVALPRGLYRVQLECSGRLETHLVDHDRETRLQHSGPGLDTPIPIEGAITTHDYYREAARRICAVDTCPPVGPEPWTARLVVFIRRQDKDHGPLQIPSEPVTLHDATGRKLLALDHSTGWIDHEYGYAALACAAAPGTYRLRTGRTRRDVAITVPALRAAHVFIADRGAVRLDALRVSLGHAAAAFDPAGRIHRAMEGVIAALRSRELDIPPSIRSLWPEAVDDDLCFGIASAHLLWRAGELELLGDVLARLNRHELPDAAILDHVLHTRIGAVVEPLVLSIPPLMRASLVLAMTHPGPTPVRVVPRSAIEQAARAGFQDSIWCTWSDRAWDARWVETAIDSLRTYGGYASIASIARTIALPVSTVEKTIANLEATIPHAPGLPGQIENLQIPGYVIGGLVGRGTQGSVYRATRQRDGVAVALKILPLSGGAEQLQSLAREPDVMERFDHPRILSLHARGVLSGNTGLWLETELCRGSVLDLLAEADAPLPVDRACQLMLQALDGLAYLHARDFVHRDIKPANLLVRNDDTVLIADLGLAKKFESHRAVRLATAGGTARFAPPEQLIDFKSPAPTFDVWSTAATLYFLLTLELPRDEYALQSEIEAARNNRIVPIAERWPEVPGALGRCIDRALSADPAARPRDARVFRRELIAALEARTDVRARALVIAPTPRKTRSKDYIDDPQRMVEYLNARGFEIDMRIDEHATRAGILAGYDALIAASNPGDTAVVCYAGASFYAVLEKEGSRAWSGIVPTDMEETTTIDFRGITSWELSIKQAQLTAKTRNVTMIFDCSYMPQMNPDLAAGGKVPLRIPHPFRLGFAEALRSLGIDDYPTFAIKSYVDAVRIFACGEDESAYSYRDHHGMFRSIFADALIDVLSEVRNEAISWEDIGHAVQARVYRSILVQNPIFEGPVQRLPFSLQESEELDIIPIVPLREDVFLLPGGQLTNIVLGDIYAVMPSGSTAYDASSALAEVEIREVFSASAIGRWRSGSKTLPIDAVAIPIMKYAVKKAVAIDASLPARATIAEAITAISTLRVADHGESNILVTLRLTDDMLMIADMRGPLYPQTPFPDALHDAVMTVANLGVAQSLRELEGEHGVFGDEVEIELGTVENGQLSPLPDHGHPLGLRDRIYVKIGNRSHRQLFFHVLNIGLRGEITVLTAQVPLGIAILSGTAFVLGENENVLQGLRLYWPADLPLDPPRLEDIIVVVTTTRIDLRSLEARKSAGAREHGPRLQDMFAQLQDGLRRDLAGHQPVDRFYMKRLSYLLHPRDVAMAGARFEIDENPSGHAVAHDPQAWVTPNHEPALESVQCVRSDEFSRTIAIRLLDLDVEVTEACSASGLRLDALVCTRSHSTGLHTWTRRGAGLTWRDVKLGGSEQLGNDNDVLFLGPAQDFVDLALWVSQDTPGSPDLADLFEQQGHDPELAELVRSLLVERSWLAAAGASAALARKAYKLIASAVPECNGLYRASWGRRDGFGIGRHPQDSTYRSRQLSFSLSVEEVR